MEKVYLNCRDSDIFYHYQNFKFYFSSRATRERFIKKLDLYINEEILKFINKYEITVDEESFGILFAFILYNKTEKRGFKVIKILDNLEFQEITKLPNFSIWR